MVFLRRDRQTGRPGNRRVRDALLLGVIGIVELAWLLTLAGLAIHFL
jgi:hypothetical protein